MSRSLLRPRRFSRSVASLASLAALATMIAACAEAPAPPPPPQVTVANVIERPVADWDQFTGHFEAVGAVEVRPRVTGFVDRVAFAEGAMVRQGDVLFVIDPRPYEAEVARAEAMLEQARTRRQLADMELERAQKLVSTQAISREELDARTSGRAEGDAAIRAAEAAVRVARLNLEWTVVRAPISGRVGRAEITPGNLVHAGAPSPTLLTTIVSLNPIYVSFDSDEQAYLKYLRAHSGRVGNGGAGVPVFVGLANESGFPHQGTLNFVDNRVDRDAGTVRVRALFDNRNGIFAPGLFARVRLSGGDRKPVTLVRDESIGTDQDRKFVLVLKADNTVEYRAITIGRVVDGLRAVQSGLKAGERIVINGMMRVRPGMRVTATDAAMVASTNAPAAGQ
jgi:RND family efflux transporter MFP subunit